MHQRLPLRSISGRSPSHTSPRTDARPVMLRLMPSDYKALKRWIGTQDISDPEAIRRLLRSHPELKQD